MLIEDGGGIIGGQRNLRPPNHVGMSMRDLLACKYSLQTFKWNEKHNN